MVADMEVDMVADMVVDMEVDKVADMDVEMEADKVSDMVADTVTDMVRELVKGWLIFDLKLSTQLALFLSFASLFWWRIPLGHNQ